MAVSPFCQGIDISQYPIAVVGSLRRDSFNRKLATSLAKLAPPEFSFDQVEIGDLALSNQNRRVGQHACGQR